jgi:hypothetical protein
VGLGRLALGDVVHGGGEATPPVDLELAQRHLDGNLAAVATQRLQLRSPANEPPMAAGQVAGQASAMGLALRFGDEQLGHLATDRLCARPAERLRRRRVPLHDAARLVHDDEALDRRVEERVEMALGQGALARVDVSGACGHDCCIGARARPPKRSSAP